LIVQGFTGLAHNKQANAESAKDRKIAHLQLKLAHKNEVVSELMEDNVREPIWSADAKPSPPNNQAGCVKAPAPSSHRIGAGANHRVRNALRLFVVGLWGCRHC
jgi:hypothetical protein